MNSAWKWIIGILLALLVLGASGIPFFVQLFYPARGYGMMGYGWQMPMMYGAYPMMGFGLLFAGLIQIGVLVLIVLGIVWLWGAIAKQNRKSE